MPEFARRLAADRPEQVAIRDQRVELGWAAVGDTLDRVANRLLAPHLAAGLGPDRRVAVFAENSVETALAHLGGLLGSTSTVPVNFHLTADEAAYILIDSASAIVFVGPETVDRAMAAVAVVDETDPSPSHRGRLALQCQCQCQCRCRRLGDVGRGWSGG